jgi:hypothetical protein
MQSALPLYAANVPPTSDSPGRYDLKLAKYTSFDPYNMFSITQALLDVMSWLSAAQITGTSMQVVSTSS